MLAFFVFLPFHAILLKILHLQHPCLSGSRAALLPQLGNITKAQALSYSPSDLEHRGCLSPVRFLFLQTLILFKPSFPSHCGFST